MLYLKDFPSLELQGLVRNIQYCTKGHHDNNPKHTANALKSYLDRKTADKTLTVRTSTESRPEKYRGSMVSPGERNK